MQLYNRTSHELEEEIVLGDGLLRFAYSTPARQGLGWLLFGFSCCSRLMGWYANRPWSCKRIEKTIKELHIDMTDYLVPQGGYTCFNDFFARRLKPGARKFSTGKLCSPADCRLLVYPELQEGTCIPVKGASFTVGELLGVEGKAYADEFAGGSLAVFRLCPSDYHRYHYADDGSTLANWKINGKYHSVNPIALKKMLKVFTSNERQVSILQLKHFGTAAFIEVGAFGVGTIRQTHLEKNFRQGDEKGYFTFGGSTVILVLRKNAVKFDADILEQSAMGRECLIKAGNIIGRPADD